MMCFVGPITHEFSISSTSVSEAMVVTCMSHNAMSELRVVPVVHES